VDAGVEGDQVVSDTDEKAKPPKTARSKKTNRADRDVGHALRAVYQDAVAESVPDDLLDLLNKLG
jgi:hypothetical protein